MEKLQPMLSKLMIVVLAACFAATSAQAKWYEASSEHFVIYADQREKDVRRFAENLERYHAALVYMRKFGDKPPPSKSNRVTIFVTDSRRDISKLAGDKGGFVAGFYVPRAGGSVAFTPPVKNTSSKIPNFSQVVLLHEYAHHYMISNLSVALPRWYTEGFAEFFGTTTFSKDGSVGLGKRQHTGLVSLANYAGCRGNYCWTAAPMPPGKTETRIPSMARAGLYFIICRSHRRGVRCIMTILPA